MRSVRWISVVFINSVLSTTYNDEPG